MPLSFKPHIRLIFIDDQQFYEKEFWSIDDLIDFIVDYFARKAEHDTEERIKNNVLKKI